MKIVELRKKSTKELTDLLQEKLARAEELSLLLVQHKVKNVKERASVRKDIARIRTLLRNATP